MGAWGAGSFENDTAMDWAAEVESLADITGTIAKCPVGTDEELDADLSCEVIAAVETLAAKTGRICADFPKALELKIKSFENPTDGQLDQGRNAVSRILRASELLDLWAEEEESAEEWNKAMTGLIARLNPDIEFKPVSREEIPEHSKMLSQCAFCDQDIADTELFYFEVRDMTDSEDFTSRGFWCHLACLNGKLHPKHIVQNWKFVVDDAEVDRILGKEAD